MQMIRTAHFEFFMMSSGGAFF